MRALLLTFAATALIGGCASMTASGEPPLTKQAAGFVAKPGKWW